MTANKPLHPNPQFERANYECLNGTWGFTYGKIDGRENCAFDGAINVPYCPESELSGIHNAEIIPDCAYTREIDVRQEDLAGRLWLRFGAVDYRAQVFVNGALAGSHTGGYTAFAVEITPFVRAGRNRITVAVH
ncbi:MAG: beta-galactosidase, partial [Clostridiales bacterium]|nr:beta-galactosidase [Clostridiales bacterium]